MGDVYTIEYSGYEEHAIIAAFTRMSDRDETWARIQAIPWDERPGYIYADWAERDVRIGNARGAVTEHIEAHSGHGSLYRSTITVHDGPLDVHDETDRSGRWKEYAAGVSDG